MQRGVRAGAVARERAVAAEFSRAVEFDSSIQRRDVERIEIDQARRALHSM